MGPFFHVFSSRFSFKPRAGYAMLAPSLRADYSLSEHW